MKHANVAFFVPHNGCPNQCSFCNQRGIIGQEEQPSPQQVQSTLQKAAYELGDRAREAEVAFFGGSFTAIDPLYRRQLLDAASPFVREGVFRGIRISTRPDAISPAILEELKRAGTTSVELGAQSMNDRILAINRRGHTAKDVETAALAIKRYGFSLGLQMMTGLYGSTPEDDQMTARRFVQLRPDTVRVYPTVVMNRTRLAELYESGDYLPLDLSASVTLCAWLLRLFDRHKIPVIRLGLHDSPQLRRDMLAGPFHPAFRELCESRIFFERVLEKIKTDSVPKGGIMVVVPPKEISKAVGQKKSNLVAFSRLGYRVRVQGNPSVAPGEFQLEIIL